MKKYLNNKEHYEALDKRTKEYKDYKEWKDNSVSKGLGDDIHKVLNSKAIKPVTEAIKSLIWSKDEDCGCDKRKEVLNKIFPRKSPECLKHNEYDFLTTLYKGKTSRLSRSENVRLYNIYNRVFKTNKKATSCGSCVKGVISELKPVYKAY